MTLLLLRVGDGGGGVSFFFLFCFFFDGSGQGWVPYAFEPYSHVKDRGESGEVGRVPGIHR